MPVLSTQIEWDLELRLEILHTRCQVGWDALPLCFCIWARVKTASQGRQSVPSSAHKEESGSPKRLKATLPGVVHPTWCFHQAMLNTPRRPLLAAWATEAHLPIYGYLQSCQFRPSVRVLLNPAHPAHMPHSTSVPGHKAILVYKRCRAQKTEAILACPKHVKSQNGAPASTKRTTNP